MNALAIIAIIFFQKRNAKLLLAGEIKEKARVLSEENRLKRPQNWGFLVASIALVTSNWFFEADIPIKFFFYLIITHLTYTAFRNRQVFRQINLPEEYISREFALGILTVLLLVFDIFYIF